MNKMMSNNYLFKIEILETLLNNLQSTNHSKTSKFPKNFQFFDKILKFCYGNFFEILLLLEDFLSYLLSPKTMHFFLHYNDKILLRNLHFYQNDFSIPNILQINFNLFTKNLYKKILLNLLVFF